MIQVPTMEDFIVLQKQVNELQRQILFMLSQDQSWLDIRQTMKALNCSRSTLHRLTKDGKLLHRYEGGKPFYNANDLRAYIESTRVSPKAADDRVLKALHREK